MRSKVELPETLAGYREAANWLVGLSTAALAGSFALLEKILPAPLATRLLLAGGAAMLLVTAAAGIVFYFWLLEIGNLIEREAELAQVGVPTQAQQSAIERIRSRTKASTRHMQMTYYVMFICFFIGMLLPIGIGGGLLFGGSAKDAPPTRVRVTSQMVERGWIVQASGLKDVDSVRVLLPTDTTALPGIELVLQPSKR